MVLVCSVIRFLIASISRCTASAATAVPVDMAGPALTVGVVAPGVDDGRGERSALGGV